MSIESGVEIPASILSPERRATFWDCVRKGAASECWEWQRALRSDGYARFNFKTTRPTKCALVHRISYALAHGSAPAGRLICHRCDNRKCVNPAHLYCGSPSDNNRDRAERDRMNLPRGEQHPNTKFDVWDIICIRADPRKNPAIAQDYGCGRTTISAIKRRQNWGHVPEFQV
jgi:hypothetical protein